MRCGCIPDDYFAPSRLCYNRLTGCRLGHARHPEVHSMRLPVLASPWATGMVALLGVVALYARSIPSEPDARDDRSSQAPEPDVPPPAALMERLGDPEVGHSVEGWSIVAMRASGGRGMSLDVERNDVLLVITIVPRNEWEHAPLVRSREYDLFYGTPRQGTVATDDIRPLLEAFATRLDTGLGSDDDSQ